MSTQTVCDKIHEFTYHFKHIKDIQFDAVPYPLDSHEGIAYLLFVASINQSCAAENVRDLVHKLHTTLGENLFYFNQIPENQQVQIIKTHNTYRWKLSEKLPRILSSVAEFVQATTKYGGLVERGRNQPDAFTAAEKIATNIYYMGKDPQGARKKVWMFMRWMVRPFPDIGVWNPPLKPSDLRIPLDVNTGQAFLDLCIHPHIQDRMRSEIISFDKDELGKLKSTAVNMEAVTKVARWFFPDDPACLDYPFFCYGRRFKAGEDKHRCWNIVKCDKCSFRSLVSCPGK